MMSASVARLRPGLVFPSKTAWRCFWSRRSEPPRKVPYSVVSPGTVSPQLAGSLIPDNVTPPGAAQYCFVTADLKTVCSELETVLLNLFSNFSGGFKKHFAIFIAKYCATTRLLPHWGPTTCSSSAHSQHTRGHRETEGCL